LPHRLEADEATSPTEHGRLKHRQTRLANTWETIPQPGLRVPSFLFPIPPRISLLLAPTPLATWKRPSILFLLYGAKGQYLRLLFFPFLPCFLQPPKNFPKGFLYCKVALSTQPEVDRSYLLPRASTPTRVFYLFSVRAFRVSNWLPFFLQMIPGPHDFPHPRQHSS